MNIIEEGMQKATEISSNIPAIFLKSCINCGGDISSDRLDKGIPCSECLPEIPQDVSLPHIIEVLRSNGKLKYLSQIYEIERRAEEFSSFFKNVVGSEPWSLQLNWAKRTFANQSFVALAPTGIGKTTFGIVMSLFTQGKSYIIMPTKLLSGLFVKRIEEIIDRLGMQKKVLFVSKSDKKIRDKVQSGDYDILITTSMFLARNENIIIGKDFDFIFVDDVDTYLKQPKNVERVLKLMGLSKDDVEKLKSTILRKYEIMRNREQSQIQKFEAFSEVNKSVAEIRKKIKGVLVISSATAKPRANTVRYFRELFGFEISPFTSTIRNIEDTYTIIDGEIIKDEDLKRVKKKVFKKVAEVVSMCGNGGFVFVNSEYGKESVDELKSFLMRRHINAVTYEEFKDENQRKFRDEEIQVVIGISSLRNPLCRGIDMPDTVRYAIFAGVPRFIFSIQEIDEPSKMLGVLFSIRSVLGNGRKIYSFIESLRRYVGMRKDDIDRYPAIKERFESIKKFIEESISNPQILQKIRMSEDVPLRVGGDGKFRLIVADSSAYIQATGRTSRLYIEGLSKGLSILIVDDKKAFVQLKKRLKIDLVDVNFKNFEEVELEKILKEVDRDREKIRLIMKLHENPLGADLKAVKPPKTAVFIVESPNKAGTIAKLIGKPMKRKVPIGENGNFAEAWEVSKGDLNITLIASGGHIYDLPFSPQKRGYEKQNFYGVEVINEDLKELFIPYYSPIKRCRRCGEHFFEEKRCPYCQSEEYDDKTKVVKAIQKICLEADSIFIATDPDSEGEKIAWDIYLMLPKYKKEIRRVEYHEVTKKAILNALEKPRDINYGLVKAQIVRRVTDRWVGFVMSENLQKSYDKIWLSAGRVQTPVLKWLIERENQMKEKIGVLKFKTANGISDIIKIEDREFARKVSKSLQKLKGRKRKKEEDEKIRLENSKILIKVELKDTEEVVINPPAPFNTAEMLKEASQKLKFSAPETMNLAQSLFEAGLITYHRTDSHHVSDVGISLARDFISENFGSRFFVPRAWEGEGAHECIRPSSNLTPDEVLISAKVGNISISEKAIKLYELIFTRFMASQMIPLKVLRGKILVSASWKANGEEMSVEKESEINLKIIEDGWNKVLFFPIANFTKELLEKKKIVVETYDFKFSFDSPVPPYTQGSLIDEMKRKGIGRPSTWAYIIKTLLDRGYCIERNGYLIVTKLGKEVYNYLKNHRKFSIYTSEQYTNELEEKMDRVEAGQEDYIQIFRNLFNELFT